MRPIRLGLTQHNTTRQSLKLLLVVCAMIFAAVPVAADTPATETAKPASQTSVANSPNGDASASKPSAEQALVIDMRETLDATQSPAPTPESTIVTEYQDAIAQIEVRNGAYAPALTEQLLGLGTSLQQLNRHEEALEVLKRGVHLSRINNGLYSREQIPLLHSEIRSYMALGDFDAVDQRQRYLYRVERQALGDTEDSAKALIRQADWQRQAYLLDVGEQENQTGRLMIMWDLYRMAFNEFASLYGKNAAELRAPLIGMLQTQYLFAGHRGFDQYTASESTDIRMLTVTSDTYRRGEAVLNGILELNIVNGASVTQHVRDTVALGDWAWWFGKEDAALIYYQQARELIPQSLDPEGLEDELFGLPTVLPALAGIGALPRPDWSDNGLLSVSFTVTEKGRVDQLEQLRKDEVELDRNGGRLLRALRGTRFRPRFEDGVPVATEGLVWSWQPEDWQSSQSMAINQR